MATRLNLVIEQGADFNQDITLLDDNGGPLPTTNYIAASQMRKSAQSANAVEFSCTLTNGNLNIKLEPLDTMAIVPGRYVWDAKVAKVDGDPPVVVDVHRLVEGIATVTPAVTR